MRRRWPDDGAPRRADRPNSLLRARRGVLLLRTRRTARSARSGEPEHPDASAGDADHRARGRGGMTDDTMYVLAVADRVRDLTAGIEVPPVPDHPWDQPPRLVAV